MEAADNDVVVDAQPESREMQDSTKQVTESLGIPPHNKPSSEDTNAKSISGPSSSPKYVDTCQEIENEEAPSKDVPLSENTEQKAAINTTERAAASQPSSETKKREPLSFYKDEEYFKNRHFIEDDCGEEHAHHNNFDILILNTDADRAAAKEYKAHLEQDIEIEFDGSKFHPRVFLLEEIRDGSNEPLDLAYSKTCFVFIYVTEAFCKNHTAVFKGSTCLQEALQDENKKWTIIPIYTVPKNGEGIKLPMMLKGLRGINFWRGTGDPDYLESVRKLIQDKIPYLRKRDSELSKKRNSIIEKNAKAISEAVKFFEKPSEPKVENIPHIAETQLTSPLASSQVNCSDSGSASCNNDDDDDEEETDRMLPHLMSQVNVLEQGMSTPNNSPEASVNSLVKNSSPSSTSTSTNVCIVFPQKAKPTVSQTHTFDNSVCVNKQLTATSIKPENVKNEFKTSEPSLDRRVSRSNQDEGSQINNSDTKSNQTTYAIFQPHLQNQASPQNHDSHINPYPTSYATSQRQWQNQTFPQNYSSNQFGWTDVQQANPPLPMSFVYGHEHELYPQTQPYFYPGMQWPCPVQPESAMFNHPQVTEAENNLDPGSRLQRNVYNSHSVGYLSCFSGSYPQINQIAPYPGQGPCIVPHISHSSSDTNIRMPTPAQMPGSLPEPMVRGEAQPADLTSIEPQSSGYGTGHSDLQSS